MDVRSGRPQVGRLASSSLVLIPAAVAAGLIVGYSALQYGLAPTGGAVLLLGFLLLCLQSVWVPFVASLAVICLLPFGVVPISTAAGTPTLLELALLATFAIYAVILLLDRRERVSTGVPQALWIGLIGVLGFAFLLGLGRGYTPQTLHDFAKFLLAIGVFALTIQLVKRAGDVALIVKLLVAGTGLASAVALVLYAGGASLTQRVLVQLIPYGYPSTRIVRYIEDNPSRAMRAVGTGVDPNSFGGLLMIGFVLSAGQVLSRQRTVPLPVSLLVFGATGAAMLFTYSRGAWVGAACGLFILLLFRKPKWLVPVAGLGVAAILLGPGAAFAQRLWRGLTLQDPATKLRLQEYQNAWEIIQRHPWFGVGFGSAPSIDLQTGVSSIYLTIAEQAGLVGLMAFAVVVAVILWRAARELFVRRGGFSDDLLLSIGAAFASALTVGLVDHYFFNPQFPHMAAVFWLLAGLLVALTAMRRNEEGRRTNHDEPAP